MKGCKALSSKEIERIKAYFNTRDDYFAIRDETLFFFSLYTGLRISETLSVNAEDVWYNDRIAESVYIQKKNTKGKVSGKNCPLNEHARDILNSYFQAYGIADRLKIQPDIALFFSNQSCFGLSTRQAHRIFRKIFDGAEIDGKTGTHVTRKTFARIVYKSLGENLLDLSVAMGHKNISSTQSYIQANDEKIHNVLNTLKF